MGNSLFTGEALHADIVPTGILADGELTFEGIAVQVDYLEGVGDALIVDIRHGDGEIAVDAIRAVDDCDVSTVRMRCYSHNVAVVIAKRQFRDVQPFKELGRDPFVVMVHHLFQFPAGVGNLCLIFLRISVFIVIDFHATGCQRHGSAECQDGGNHPNKISFHLFLPFFLLTFLYRGDRPHDTLSSSVAVGGSFMQVCPFFKCILSNAKLKRHFEFLVIDCCAVYCFFFEEFALGERLLYLSTPPVSEG